MDAGNRLPIMSATDVATQINSLLTPCRLHVDALSSFIPTWTSFICSALTVFLGCCGKSSSGAASDLVSTWPTKSRGSQEPTVDGCRPTYGKDERIPDVGPKVEHDVRIAVEVQAESVAEDLGHFGHVQDADDGRVQMTVHSFQLLADSEGLPLLVGGYHP